MARMAYGPSAGIADGPSPSARWCSGSAALGERHSLPRVSMGEQPVPAPRKADWLVFDQARVSISSPMLWRILEIRRLQPWQRLSLSRQCARRAARRSRSLRFSNPRRSRGEGWTCYNSPLVALGDLRAEAFPLVVIRRPPIRTHGRSVPACVDNLGRLEVRGTRM